MTDNSQTTNDGIKPLPEQTITDRQHLVNCHFSYFSKNILIQLNLD